MGEWVPIDEARLRSQDGVIAGNTVTFTSQLLSGGFSLVLIDYDELTGLETAQIRVVLTGASSDAYTPDGTEGLAVYKDAAGDSQTRYFFPAGIADFSEDFTVTLNTTDFDNQGELSLSFIVGGGGDVDNFNGIFTIYEWGETPPPEAPVCFWTDLVNAVQVCDAGGVDGVISFAGASGNCGGTPGKFYLDQAYANAALDAALTIATEVTITGVYQDDIPVGDFETVLESAIPEYVTLTDVDYPMSFTDAWETADIPALDATFGQWFRLDVDGTIYYAAGVLWTPC